MSWLRQALGRKSDGGYTATEFALAAGVLVLPSTLLVTAIPVWFSSMQAADAATATAARILATGTDWRNDLQVADDTIRTREQAGSWTVTSSLIRGSQRRGAEIFVTTEIAIPALDIPFIGKVGALTYTARAHERVDDYRSVP